MSERLTVSELANNVLGVLRHLRDNEPNEWDALTKTDSGVLLVELWDALKSASEYQDGFEAALREIAKREGAFSQDHLTHAKNTIENMARIAEAALDGVSVEAQ